MRFSFKYITTLQITGVWLLAVLLLSCEQERATPESAVIAEVGSHKLTIDEVLERIPPYAAYEDSLTSVERYRSQWVREQILADEAARLGLNQTSAFRDAMASYERQLLIQLLMDHAMNQAGETEVTREQAMRYYEQHRDQFVLSERHVRFHHMVAATMDDATQARTDLLRGVEWNEIAENYSVDPSYALRTSTVFHPLSTALNDSPAMAQFIGLIGVSEVSPIRNINGQYHFVQLLENQDEGTVPELDWALEQIEHWISIEQKRTQLNAFQQNLIRQAEANRSIRLHD